MKSYWISKTPRGTVLDAREVAVPRAAAGQVVVRMHATSINRGDILASISRHSASAGRPAGVDGAGTVHAVGDGVTRVAVGDRVMVRAKGAFAEYAATDASLVTPLPQNMSWEHAAAIPVAYITAYEAVMQFGHLKAGEWILIAGASGGVGVAALQAARMIGARVIGVSGSAEKLDRLRKLGLDVGIRARGAGFAQAARAATDGKGIDLAVNLVGGTAFPDCVEALADFGYVDGQMKAELDLESVHGKRLDIFGVSNAPLSTAQRAVAQRGFERELYPALADGRIVPVIDRVFDFDQAMEAKAYVERNELLGKVVIRIV
jgi:NADPH:quinone reductase